MTENIFKGMLYYLIINLYRKYRLTAVESKYKSQNL